MADYDLHSNVLAAKVFASQTYLINDVLVSTIVDTFCYGSLEFITNLGTITDNSATYTVEVEHGNSPTLSDAVPVPDEYLIGGDAANGISPEQGASFTDLDDGELRRIGYVGKRRYVRYRITPLLNAGLIFSVTAILSNPLKAATPENDVQGV